jgi:hypothetical protein
MDRCGHTKYRQPRLGSPNQKEVHVKAVRFLALLLVVFLLVALPLEVSAQGPTVPPALPTLEQWLKLSLGAIGTLVCINLMSYYWAFWITALAAKVSFPSWLSASVQSAIWQLAILIPTAAVAAAWNAFATFINSAYPGALETTLGGAILWIGNWLMTLFWSRRGGLANLAEIKRLGLIAVARDFSCEQAVARARRAVLLL